MRCRVHGIEMEYMGENDFGQDIYRCDECEDDWNIESLVCLKCGLYYEDCQCDAPKYPTEYLQ